MEYTFQELAITHQANVQNSLRFYLKAAKADEDVEKLAKYLAVLSLLDHERLSFWPSTVAAGLVILASLATDHDSSCNWVMEVPPLPRPA